MTQTRRNFLKTGAAVGAAAVLRSRGAASLTETTTNAPAITAPLKQFGYGDVELLEGPLREQFDAIMRSIWAGRRRAAEALPGARRICRAGRRDGRVV